MNTRQKLSIGLPLTAALVLLLNGCVVDPVDPYYVSTRVVVAPPAPHVEVVGVAPGTGYIWIGGYWDWRDSRYVWRPGRWAPPRHGHRWVHHRWVQDGPYWHFHRGHWERQ